jgi:hypothetical protein
MEIKTISKETKTSYKAITIISQVIKTLSQEMTINSMETTT